MQETALLSGSVQDNIRFPREDATDEQMRAAARRAHGEAFVEELPDGFRTTIGERGATLSGGQRQRIAIARCSTTRPSSSWTSPPARSITRASG